MDPLYAALDATELFRICAERRSAMERVCEECPDPLAQSWIRDLIVQSDHDEGTEIASMQAWVDQEGGEPDVDRLAALSIRLSAVYNDVVNLADEDADG